jgi:phosphoribosylglycinamide formyltransferase 1
MLKVAVFASSAGSNLAALIEASQAPRAGFEIALVVSNNSASGALVKAAEHQVCGLHVSSRTHPVAEEHDQAVLAALQDHEIGLVVLAGYMKKIGPRTLAAYQDRILNVHPALLPRHGGQGMYGRFVHEAVLAAGDTVSGASVHVVTGEYDQGPVIARHQVPVLPGDTPDTLAARVLEAEHKLLPVVVADFARRWGGHGREVPLPPAHASSPGAGAGTRQAQGRADQ